MRSKNESVLFKIETHQELMKYRADQISHQEVNMETEMSSGNDVFVSALKVSFHS